MTAIAYRDGCMAADSLATAGGTVGGYSRKIAKRDDGALIGCSGGAGHAARLMQAFLDHRLEAEEPTKDKDNPYAALVVMPDGSVWRATEAAPLHQQAAAPFYTEGCAYQILLGAMAFGASAEEAVRVAIDWEIHCGGEVHTERLGP